MDYTQLMLGIIQSTTFSRWLAKLKDRAVIMRINAQIRRVAETGNFGDAKPVRDGVNEESLAYPTFPKATPAISRCAQF